MMVSPDNKPILEFPDKAAWTDWLIANHAQSMGIWIRFAKKNSGLTSVTYDEAVDASLCFGWIDGQVRSEGERTYIQKYTPRGKRSIWSKRNVAKVATLIENDEMRPAGLSEVERAKADGRWQAAYDGPRTAETPEDLTAALAANETAKAFYETLSSKNRYALIFRLQTVKRPETRARRIEEFVEMLEKRETFH